MANRIDKYAEVACDCGHLPKDHPAWGNRGQCEAIVDVNGKPCSCGCTWYNPNVEYIKAQKKLKSKRTKN